MSVGNGVSETYKVVAVFQVASYGQLAGSVALRGPFAPVEGVDGPGSQVIAGTGLSIGEIISVRAVMAIRHARVGSGPDISEAERGV